MNYLQMNLWITTVTILYYNYAVVAVEETKDEEVIQVMFEAASAGIPDQSDEQESEEFENSLVKNVRNDYSNGFHEMLTFFDSVNKTMTVIMEKIQNLEAQVAKINDEYKTRISSIERVVSFNRMPLPTGKSFNRSTLSQIITRVSSAGDRGRYTAVVFANYLDEVITDFTIYDKNNATFNPAPTFIPAHTEEVFTFYEPHCCFVETSFSYVIPSNGVRIASISLKGARGAGLAFATHDENMKTYYDSKTGINGSSIYESGAAMDRNMSVGYQNLFARLLVRAEGEWKATLRIELIKLP